MKKILGIVCIAVMTSIVGVCCQGRAQQAQEQRGKSGSDRKNKSDRVDEHFIVVNKLQSDVTVEPLDTPAVTVKPGETKEVALIEWTIPHGTLKNRGKHALMADMTIGGKSVTNKAWQMEEYWDRVIKPGKDEYQIFVTYTITVTPELLEKLNGQK